MIEDKKEKLILHLKPNYCKFTAFIIDPAMIIGWFFLAFISVLLNAWWSILLAVIIFILSLGLLKSLFLKEVELYEDRVVLRWYLFGEKIIYINEIRGVVHLTAGWCWQLVLSKRQFFDFKSMGMLISASVLGEEGSIRLKKEIKKLLGEIK